MIKFDWVNENNYKECFDIRKNLFNYDFSGNIYERVAKKVDIDKYLKIDYAIIKNEDNESIGTIGYYISKSAPDSCWVGWYGILADYRGKGYSNQIMESYIKYIKDNVKIAKYLYVYTDFVECKTAIHGYTKYGMQLEKDKFYKDKYYDKWCILGMSLYDEKYKEWNKDPIWCED